jgi:hypothetical protein
VKRDEVRTVCRGKLIDVTVERWADYEREIVEPRFCRERMRVFVAEDVEPSASSPADDEDLELVHWPVGEIEGRLGELEDAKTIAGLLLSLREFRSGIVARP